MARGDEHFDVDPLAENGRGLRLILRAVDFFDVEMNAGKNITTLMKALPDPAVNYSTEACFTRVYLLLCLRSRLHAQVMRTDGI